jgi:hypothetical protein
MASTDLLLQALKGAGYNVTTNPDGSTSAAPLPPVTQAAVQNPQLNENVLAAITGSAQAVTPDIVVANDSSQTTPRFDNSTGSNSSFEQQNENAPIYGGGGLRANAQRESAREAASLARERLSATENQNSVTNLLARSALALKERESNIRTAKLATDIALEKRKQDDLLKTHYDTGGLLQYLNTLHHDDPEYDAKLGAGLANFSRYDPSKLAPILESQKAARAAHQEGVKLGGAAQYSHEAQSVFHDVTANGGSPFEAHAAAKAREKDITTYNDAVSKGYLTDADRSKIVDANGVLDYAKAATVAAANAGTITGKPVTQAEKDAAASYKFIENYAKNPDLQQDPNAKALNAIHIQRILAYEKNKSPGLVAPQKTASDYLNGL